MLRWFASRVYDLTWVWPLNILWKSTPATYPDSLKSPIRSDLHPYAGGKVKGWEGGRAANDRGGAQRAGLLPWRTAPQRGNGLLNPDRKGVQRQRSLPLVKGKPGKGDHYSGHIQRHTWKFEWEWQKSQILSFVYTPSVKKSFHKFLITQGVRIQTVITS